MGRKQRLLLLISFLFMAPSVKPGPRTARQAVKPSAKPAAKPAPTGDWAAQTLAKMSEDEKLGQLLCVYYFGALTPTESSDYQQLLRSVEEMHVGGFVLQTRGTPLGIEKSQAYPSAALANQLQAKAKVPLLVAADFERGTAMRLDEGTSFPQAMAVGATGDPHDGYTMGKITALEARAVGVQWVFAPVADVNSNPANPIINVRSFGEDPKRVAQYVAQFVRGVEENGALATAKHFPGHGDVSTDSHLDLPLANASKSRLESMEFVPFRAAISAGVSTMMTGHLAVPALEPNRDLPATLSRKITTDVLRTELGFRGIVVTDAMDMAGVAARYSPGEAAVDAIAAGADVLLIPPFPDAALGALKEAVRTGRLPMSRVNDAAMHVLRAKAKLGLNKQRMVDLNALNHKFAQPEFERAAQDIADRGVTLLRNSQKVLPLDSTKPLRLLVLAVSGDADAYPAANFEREIHSRADAVSFLRTDTKFEPASGIQLPSPDSYDAAIAAIFVRVADRKGSVGLPDDQAALVEKLLGGKKPAIVACFGSPYIIERFPKAQTWLAAFSTMDVAQIAAVRAMFGQVAIQGQLPVSVPDAKPPLKIGAGINVAANPMRLRAADASGDAKLARAYAILDQGVADGAFPGGVIAVGRGGAVTLHAFGRQTYDAKSAKVTPETIYDAASLTKPVVTTTLIAQFVEAGRLQLDAPISVMIPEWLNTAKDKSGAQIEWRKRVTLRNLLTHTSGLPGHVDYFADSKSEHDIAKRVIAEPLVYEPGTKSEYSDLDFILLGEMLERLTGRSLDSLAAERIFAPIGMSDTSFNPSPKLKSRIAPTENDTAFRKEQIRGEVHDENAWAMDGVAGHAGMFATARDLAAFAQMMLNGGIYAHHRLLKRATVEEFTEAQDVSAKTRTLGWMAPTENSSSGHYLSKESYGHTGFTGTSIWIDPKKDLFVVLLTNRVYPTRENNKLAPLRPQIHDAVVEGLGLR
jgi:beta-glucosidase-like glycosyl hydrolase/CubicO group peptidase (beta-lactamase class C family)